MKFVKPGDVDPLYVIFEEHLFSFQDSDADRKTFICNIVIDYLTYLRKMNVVVPKSLEQPVVEELANQVNTMLVKKIYGCLTISDYQKKAAPTVKRKARTRYTKLKKNSRSEKTAASAPAETTGAATSRSKSRVS